MRSEKAPEQSFQLSQQSYLMIFVDSEKKLEMMPEYLLKVNISLSRGLFLQSTLKLD
jgi:hypothetical protein